MFFFPTEPSQTSRSNTKFLEKEKVKKATEKFKEGLEDRIEDIIEQLKKDRSNTKANIPEDIKNNVKNKLKIELAEKVGEYFSNLDVPLEVKFDPANKASPFFIVSAIESLKNPQQDSKGDNNQHASQNIPQELQEKIKAANLLEDKLNKNSRELDNIINSCVDNLAASIEQGKGIDSAKKDLQSKIAIAVGTIVTVVAAAAAIAAGVALAVLVPGAGLVAGLILAIEGPMVAGVVGGLATWAVNEGIKYSKGEVTRDGVSQLESMCKVMEKAGELVQKQPDRGRA
ncbi:hypothetical protein NF27_JF00150 [Candidatus Jidaibacter acanthamoeba]|uniref:Uncharacterized protein n=1 Tax=Candidatus Jidaibacter acanthamoebae TaxID=86105 RepID=A0A0C1MQA2_9RICK|nr:hypothetical protein [Candidatus Jidaibacter acanthamoeba]KIE04137.1 hypothetical protein NF27_JF00150 [Candidatus Jidaibacter acanthamoeba]